MTSFTESVGPTLRQNPGPASGFHYDFVPMQAIIPWFLSGEDF